MYEERTLQLAGEAIRLGDRHSAQVLLGRALRRNPRSETAWLWLSGLVDERDKQIACLERVLAINPQNEIAQQHLRELQGPPTAIAAAQAVVSVNVYTAPARALLPARTQTSWRPLILVGLLATLGFIASLLWLGSTGGGKG
jgi:hypothetical protein